MARVIPPVTSVKPRQKTALRAPYSPENVLGHTTTPPSPSSAFTVACRVRYGAPPIAAANAPKPYLTCSGG